MSIYFTKYKKNTVFVATFMIKKHCQSILHTKIKEKILGKMVSIYSLIAI